MSAELTQAERGRLLEATHFSHRACEHIAPAVEKILSDRLARVEALLVSLAEVEEVERKEGRYYPARLVAAFDMDLRAALAPTPAPTEAANVAQIGSDERVGTKEDA